MTSKQSAPSLEVSMKTFGALLITLSAVTPASSVFIIAPGVIQQAGTGAFLSFVVAAIVGIFTAFVYGELSSAFPLAGGEYAIIGRVLGPLWGTVALGINLTLVILSLSILSVGIGNYLKPLFPNVDAVTAGAATLVVTTLCGLLNLRTNAIVTGLFLCLELAALVVLTYLGLAHPERSLASLVREPVHLATTGALEPVSFGLIGLAVSVAIFAYNGYGQAVYLGEEIHNAPKRIAQTILLALVVSVLAQAIPVTAVLIGAPDLSSLLGSSDMLGDFITLRGSARLNTFVSLSIALAILNANIAFIVLIARILFSTGRDHIWNAGLNRALTRMHSRFHSPWVATLVAGGLGIVTCFVDQKILLVLTGTGIVVIYALLCLTVIVGRRNGTTAHGHYKMPWFPIVPYAALIMMAYVVYANFQDPEIGRPSLAATACLMAVSALYYFCVLKRRAEWKLKGPDAEDF